MERTKFRQVAATMVAFGLLTGHGADVAHAKGTAVAAPGNTYFIDFDLSGGQADVTFDYEKSGDEAFAADFDGDGKDTLGVRIAATNMLVTKNTLEGGMPDNLYHVGSPNEQLVIGDFHGESADTVAFRTGKSFRVHHQLNDTAPTTRIDYGRVGDDVFVGDWNGDGVDTFAVRRGNTFHVKNTIEGGNADIAFDYGRIGDEVLVGDWDGDGIDTFAVRRGNIFHVKNDFISGVADRSFSYGRPTDAVIVGRWDGNRDAFAVRRDTSGSNGGGAIAQPTPKPGLPRPVEPEPSSVGSPKQLPVDPRLGPYSGKVLHPGDVYYNTPIPYTNPGKPYWHNGNLVIPPQTYGDHVTGCFFVEGRPVGDC